MRSYLIQLGEQARPAEETWLVPFIGIACVLVLLWY